MKTLYRVSVFGCAGLVWVEETGDLLRVGDLLFSFRRLSSSGPSWLSVSVQEFTQ